MKQRYHRYERDLSIFDGTNISIKKSRTTIKNLWKWKSIIQQKSFAFAIDGKKLSLKFLQNEKKEFVLSNQHLFRYKYRT